MGDLTELADVQNDDHADRCWRMRRNKARKAALERYNEEQRRQEQRRQEQRRQEQRRQEQRLRKASSGKRGERPGDYTYKHDAKAPGILRDNSHKRSAKGVSFSQDVAETYVVADGRSYG